MRSAKAKESGDTNMWEDEARNPRVTSASLIVPKEIAREMFHPDGRISDKRLETIQYKCFCQFQLVKLSAKNPGCKVCERVVVTYSYPTKNHQVTLRLFNELAQQCASALRIASMVKVSSVIHKPAKRAKSAADSLRVRGSAPQQPGLAGDAATKATTSAEDNKDSTTEVL